MHVHDNKILTLKGIIWYLVTMPCIYTHIQKCFKWYNQAYLLCSPGDKYFISPDTLSDLWRRLLNAGGGGKMDDHALGR